MRILDPGWRQFGSGIRNGKKSDPGSRINFPDPESGLNIPDPQHWIKEALKGMLPCLYFKIFIFKVQ
jgi:hypothetical protein